MSWSSDIEDVGGNPDMGHLLPIAYGLLQAHTWTRAIVFWCADGEDGWASTYGAFARPLGDGRAKLIVRLMGAGGLDYPGNTS